MLNLSDNELDRLSREAASQHDPGDLTGPQAWERLEVRLDKELGRAGPDISRGLRGFRRLPFQYAPVILLIVGVSYYFVKQAKGRKAENSGSPPLTVVKAPQQQPGTLASDSSTQNPDYRDKSTSTPYHQDQSQNIDSSLASAEPAPTDVSGASRNVPAGAAKIANTPGSASNGSVRAPNTPVSTPGASGGVSNAFAPSSGSTRTPSGHSGISPGTSGRAAGKSESAAKGLSKDPSAGSLSVASPITAGNHLAATTGFRSRHPHDHPGANGRQSNNMDKSNKDISKTTTDGNTTPSGNTASNNISGLSAPAGLSRSFIRRPQFPHSRPTISDSALRAYTAQTPTNPGKKNGPSLRISRPITFGLQVAPDFASVNALAGDKPGSSIGVTVDYQVLDRWHLGTGLLFSRKNYTARATDFKAPPDYYRSVGLKDVDFIKGKMNMLEIPLNLRYDFSVTGNTVFFASGGVSTYLFGSERNKYYFDFFGREVCREFQYTNKQGILSSANLSLGVETGISNDFSIMVAPYMKLPLSDLGFGRVRMSSVGINVGLRYSPVLSRKRKR
ncbi:outer membrane beta-barrel protein [Flavitalea sp. BT771]|uniref:porin family protein n=1 Tax=Flavitalea sp. BT771 TaxID=3063329 RepID=UPI0026E37848|nr:outer membrane beta-barrel protein [Flavitalea sp. BT771]MDO6429827.1 outer membrane beta-barrel protein [Flavitalea sp. BT771]MDV6218045.1 outer membrane beta-barrel protein [Flavitalea sp. BT771]